MNCSQIKYSIPFPSKMQVKNEFFYFFLAFLSDPQVNLCYDIFWDYYYKSFQLFYMYSRNLFVLDFVRKTSRVHLHRMEVIFLDNVHWRNIMTEKLEKLKQGYTNLSEWLEHIMAAIVLIAIVIAIASLWEPFKEFLHTRTESGSFLEYMASVFDIVIGIEFFKLLCKPRKDTMLEVLMFLIARHMIIEHTTAVENLLSIIAISILIIVDRYFLKSKTLN